jgi:uncharacterized lipoprotein YddW (UPF0748 family)
VAEHRSYSFRIVRNRLSIVLLLLVAACSGSGGGPTSPTPGTPTTPTTPLSADPPALAREFRGLWVATVANIDWPTQTGLSQTAAVAEMRTILDRAALLKMNAIVLQIRAAGDALYPTQKEPWARSLGGAQGIDPGWDPLATWITEAHARGLELHAWFNPYRAGNLSDTNRLAANHLAKARPDLARIAQGQIWFDPGEPEVQQHTIDVITDVLARYDVDGVHLDDYFYPYPIAGAAIPVQFPDDASYAKYIAAGGAAMARADWRRQNVDLFLQRLYAEVHRVKPTMRVGISPFGIWRPGNPAGITGLDAYADIFADSKKWLENGWVDYFAPQLYWPLTSIGQNFTALLDWWLSVNTKRRHLWPGLAAYRVADGSSSAYAASEITAEITAVRLRAGASAGGASGALLYNTTSVRLNRGGLSDALIVGSYASPGIVPAFPWIDAIAMPAPTLAVSQQSSAMRLQMTPGDLESPRWWVVQWRTATAWETRVVWGATRTLDLSFSGTTDRANVIVLTAFDASMNASPTAIWRAATH